MTPEPPTSPAHGLGQIELADHPAKYTPTILAQFRMEVYLAATYPNRSSGVRRFPQRFYVLDPMAGSGRVHELAGKTENGVEVITTGVEIEPEWAAHHSNTVVGDALKLPEYWPRPSFDAIVVSPCYGNRMADHHNNQDECRDCDGDGCAKCRYTGMTRRHTYKHYLGRELSAGSSAGMQWGDAYRGFHKKAWAQAFEVTLSGGIFLLNIKDHIRHGEIQEVTRWHIGALENAGYVLERHAFIETPGLRDGRNGAARVNGESVIRFRKP